MTGGALAGVRVVDLSRVLAGPYCAQLLGDHGADVVKVEPLTGDLTRSWGPTRPDGVSAYYAGLNRNKRHLAADLSTPGGRDLVLGLLAEADVLVENFKPGAMTRWGLAPDTLAERFPRLVHCRISAFGPDGPMAGLPGYDAVIQAYTGIMDLNGEPEGPPLRVPMPVVDLTTGLLALSGVLLALRERAESGKGQRVDISLVDGALSLLHPAAATYFMTGAPPRRLGSAHPNIAPCDTFPSPAGDIYVAAGNDRQFAALTAFLGAPELADDPRFRRNADRLAHRHELDTVLARLIAALDPATDLARTLITEGVPATLVRTLPQALDAEDVTARGMVTELDGLRTLGVPVRLSRTPGSIRTPARPLGADQVAEG
ncbi:CaiB/BaiF CoA transferase family protein [Streptomyces sp. NPDC090106]|uniref:CaiB/BaiF CoA transferase family protein n=1 Tax=Streptomyces sp. NPDC090106 TaxID=3365946 RepID=UPI00382142F9